MDLIIVLLVVMAFVCLGTGIIVGAWAFVKGFRR